jgi:hypothetical protein
MSYLYLVRLSAPGPGGAGRALCVCFGLRRTAGRGHGAIQGALEGGGGGGEISSLQEKIFLWCLHGKGRRRNKHKKRRAPTYLPFFEIFLDCFV